ncbi:GPW/gp25 family protein [Undibacterium sp. Ji50W]|uniref:GPW/gp25 family protein n=1 Tax=Undibacterium sp. Ji50W TaxID=3413041 RepID=UPI003BF188BB
MPYSTENNREILGRGIAFFPLRLMGGTLGMNEYDEHIRQSIRLILGTAYHERAMRPDFGGGMEALTFEPMNPVTAILAQLQVQTALAKFEPRIDVLTVQVSALPDEGKLNIDIIYRVRSTDTVYNLVYPFYIERGGL